MKGVSRLNLLEKIALYEMERQEMLSSLAEEIKRRNPDLEHIEILDVTDIFRETKSKLIKNGLQKGHRVLGIRVPGFSGLLKSDRYRFGKELAEVVKVIGIPGIFHSDELPNYGIGENEVRLLREKFSTGDNDAFIIIVAEENKGKEALLYVMQRIRKAINGVNPETRGPRDDGTTEFLRPLPGSERMYPETDVPLYHISEQTVLAARKIKPRSKDQIEEELVKTYGISGQDASIIISGGIVDTFQAYARAAGSGKVAARIILQTLPEIEKKTGKKADHERIIDLIVSVPVKDRSVLETAIEMLEVRNMNKDEILNSDEIIPMREEELRREIIRLWENGEIGEKNLIPALRKKTGRLFDPSLAFRIFKNISKVQK